MNPPCPPLFRITIHTNSRTTKMMFLVLPGGPHPLLLPGDTADSGGRREADQPNRAESLPQQLMFSPPLTQVALEGTLCRCPRPPVPHLPHLPIPHLPHPPVPRLPHLHPNPKECPSSDSTHFCLMWTSTLGSRRMLVLMLLSYQWRTGDFPGKDLPPHNLSLTDTTIARQVCRL